MLRTSITVRPGIDMVKTCNYIGDDTPCIGVIAQDLQDSDMGKYFVFKQP